jgi:quercetin dioxygenase-like cupin family protein
MAETFTLTPTEILTLVSSAPDALVVEASFGPGHGAPPAHLHPAQDEHFEVLEGELRASVDGEERTLAAGDTLEVPRGSVHRMWNPTDSPTRARWETRPAGRTEEWFRAMDRLQREGHVRPDGTPSPLAFAVLASEYRDTFRLAVGPDWLTAPAIGVLGRLGRLRGYRA